MFITLLYPVYFRPHATVSIVFKNIIFRLEFSGALKASILPLMIIF